MASTIRYLEEELGLLVNREKSKVAPIEEVTFLGFRIIRDKISMSPESYARFKDRVKRMTHRNNPKSMEQIVEELNSYLRGWGTTSVFNSSVRYLLPWINGYNSGCGRCSLRSGRSQNDFNGLW